MSDNLGKCVFCGAPLLKVTDTLYQCENCRRLYWLAVQVKVVLCCTYPEGNDHVHLGRAYSRAV